MQILIKNAKVFNGQAFLPGHYNILIENGYVRLFSRQSIIENPDKQIIIDARFKTVLPAFIEGHNHFVAHALQRARLDLSQINEPREGLELIKEYAKKLPSGEWVRGGGWSFARWGTELVHKRILDKFVPDHPVALESTDFHSIWINTQAQKELGIPDNPADTPDGKYGRDQDGIFNGILYENVRMLVYEKVPPPSKNFVHEAVQKNIQYYYANGFTHAITMDGDIEINVLRDIKINDPFSVSWYFPFRMLEKQDIRDIKEKYATENIYLVGPKLFMDGSFGSQTAWLSKPYVHSNNTGVPVLNVKEAEEIIRIAHDHSMGAAIHAIGDKAIHEAVGLFEKSFLERKYTINFPNRLEHVQLPDDMDIKKISYYQLGVSIQPNHIGEDIPIIEKYLADRKHLCYPFRKMELYHVPLIMSSDAPVKEINPWENMYWGITQRDPRNKDRQLNPREILTLSTALKGYTSTAAFYSGIPNSGKIQQGFPADIIILNKDLSSIYSAEEILEVEINYTISKGKIVYKNEKDFS